MKYEVGQPVWYVGDKYYEATVVAAPRMVYAVAHRTGEVTLQELYEIDGPELPTKPWGALERQLRPRDPKQFETCKYSNVLKMLQPSRNLTTA